MNRWIWLGVVLVAVAVALGAEDVKKSKGVFSTLKVGQNVTLKDEKAAFTISFFDEDLPLAHKVIEIGEDYVVIRDVVGIKETTIPVYALKAVEKIRVKPE